MGKRYLLAVFASMIILLGVASVSAYHYDESYVSTYYRESTPFGSITERTTISSDRSSYSFTQTSRFPSWNPMHSYWHYGPPPARTELRIFSYHPDRKIIHKPITHPQKTHHNYPRGYFFQE
jgi:hypothetical protein